MQKQQVKNFLLLVVSIVVLLASVYWRLYRPYAVEAPRYGDVLSETAIKVGAESIDIRRGRWYYIFVGNLSQEAEIIAHVNSLMNVPQLRTGNLIPIALIEGHAQVGAKIEEYVADNQVRFPVIPLHDVEPSTLVDLQVGDHERRHVLVDPELRVVFSASFVKPADVRSLFEKYFRTPVPRIEHPPIALGQLADFPILRAVNSGDEITAFNSKAVITLTSSCVTCSLNTRVTEIAQHQDAVAGSAAMKGLDLLLLLSPSFEAEEIGYYFEDAGIELPSFVAASLPGIEDDYSRETYRDLDSVVFETGQTGQVTKVLSWDAYLEEVFSTEGFGEAGDPFGPADKYLNDGTGTVALKPIDSLSSFLGQSGDLALAGDRLFVVDQAHHFVVSLNEDLQVERVIGGIGHAGGEFYYPGMITADDDGDLVAADGGNDRIQLLRHSGEYRGEIPVDKTWGLAIVGRNIVFGRPASGSLLEVYDLDGTWSEAIGDLSLPPGLTYAQEEEPVYRKAFNRVHLASASDDQLVVAYQHRPLIKILSIDGQSVGEFALEEPSATRLGNLAVHSDGITASTRSVNIDGLNLPIVIGDVGYDRTRNEIVVLLGDSNLLFVGTDGQVRKTVSIVGLASPTSIELWHDRLFVSSHGDDLHYAALGQL